MVLVIRCQTLLQDLWTIWSCCFYVFYYYHILSYPLGSIFYEYMVLFLFDKVIYVFYCYDYVFSPYVYVWLPWLRFSHAFSSVVSKCQGKTRKDGARPALFLIFVLFYIFLCSLYCLLCDVPSIVCVHMCTEQLPPGGYPIAVKYIISHVVFLEGNKIITTCYNTTGWHASKIINPPYHQFTTPDPGHSNIKQQCFIPDNTNYTVAFGLMRDLATLRGSCVYITNGRSW
jgi:hypothetical protein